MKRLLLFVALIAAARGEFALKDGDKLAFLGDSITAARGYSKVVEHYTLMRYPERKVRFVNAGEGGDTAAGCLKRLQSDVFDQGATVVTVAFGINDIGWGTKADDEHKQAYLDGIRTIIERCREKKVRPYICSPAIVRTDPDDGENSYLQKMADEGMALARSMGAETIDLQRGMRNIQRGIIAANQNEKDPEKHITLHVADGIHLNDLGQLAMGYAMLKGLGAPDEVSSVTLDVKYDTSETLGCEVRDVKKLKDGLAFTRIDEGLPLNFGPFTILENHWVPVSDGLNRYLLTVKGLSEGEYEVLADGRSLGKSSSDALARGMNIASATGDGFLQGGPWDVQSCAVKEMVDARDKLWESGRLLKTRSESPDEEALKKLQEIDDQLVSLQRLTAKPKPYKFKITRIP